MSNQQSIDQDIENWLKQRPVWLREAASRLSKAKLTEKDIGDLVNLLKDPDNGSVLSTQSELRKNTHLQSLHLNSISEISGIDQLRPKNPLKFGDSGITVIYGKNGSGKSGYVRILKKISGKSNEPLKANVYQPTPIKRSIKISYTINGNKNDIEWDVEHDPIDHLISIDIFDSDVGRAYISKEMTTTYSPAQLEFFDDLGSTCDKIKEKLINERDSQILQFPAFPDIPSEYHNTAYIEQLNSLIEKTDAEKIDALISWSDEETKKIDDLDARLKTVDPQKKAIETRDKKGSLDQLIKRIQKIWDDVGPEGYQEFTNLKKAAQEARHISEGARASTSSDVLLGIGSLQWNALWKAAEQYSSEIAYPSIPFPNTADHSKCVLCHQDLDDNGKKRLIGFQKFVTEQFEIAATAAESKLERKTKDLTLDSQEVLEGWITSLGLKNDLSLYNELRSFFDQYKNTHEWLTATNPVKELQKKVFKWIETSDGFSNILDDELQWFSSLKEISMNLEAEALKFEEDAKQFDLTKATQEKRELAAKKWAFEQKDAVKSQLKRKETLAKFEEWIKETNTTQISKKASEISQKVITEPFVDRFNQELSKLGVKKNIKVQLVKAKMEKGKCFHKIQLVGANSESIERILSEGYKRMTELAGFLADVASNHATSPFIFDDPISSLDQDFEEKTIDRLIDLSESRQVIVFTHRLSFLGILIGKLSDATQVCIREEPWGCGEPTDFLITESRPKNAINKLKNESLPAARKEFETGGVTKYSQLSQSICSNFRTLLERIVELELLADVVQRHRRAIHTKQRLHNLSKINANDCKLIDNLMTKYSRFEHSQSVESPVDLPYPDEIEEDIDKLMSWLDEFTKRELTPICNRTSN